MLILEIREDPLRADSPIHLTINTGSNLPPQYKFNGTLFRPDEDLAGTKQSSRGAAIHLVRTGISPWSQSVAKRILDCVCILPSLPLLIPVLLFIALAVRLTSPGPVLFLQTRVGRLGRMFTILKFRTLEHCGDGRHNAVTTTGNQRFTPVGPFLRKWKLDELPQLWNVLIGDMSLVGARPKLPAHQLAELQCRPGITGAATLAFAREESVLAQLPNQELNSCYRDVILPAKHRIDQEYLARATFFSDLHLLFKTITGRWDTSLMEHLLKEVVTEKEARMPEPIIVRALAPVGIHEKDMIQMQRLTEA